MAFGTGAAAFAASSISFCRRGTAAPACTLNAMLQSRQASCAPKKSHGFSSSRVSTPTPVTCDPRSGDPQARSFAACCLLCASSFCSSAFCQTLQRSRELLMHCSHSIFCHLGVSGKRCLSVDSESPARIPAWSLDAGSTNQYGFQLSHGSQIGGVQTVNASSATMKCDEQNEKKNDKNAKKNTADKGFLL